jgi:glycosyltransferase involved in cell wall biosynthesis
LFVLTSSGLRNSVEGFGIVYLEANACGTPVLAARIAGAAEAVEEGESGFFVEEPSVSRIAQALDSYLSGKIRFESSACIAFARKFTWKKVVDHASQFYSIC